MNRSNILESKAEVAHLVERQPSKLKVAGSSPVFRSIQPVLLIQPI